MGSLKTLIKYGLLAKIEASYADPATVLAGATDGVDLLERATIDVQYMHDGKRAGKSPASTGGRKRVGRMGRFGQGTVKIEPCGASAAFAAGVVPNFHALMRMAGYTATIDTTADAETVTYTPSAAGTEASGALENYARGQKYGLQGVYANAKMTCDVPGIPQFEFECMGTMKDLPSDAAVPAITYPTLEPPKAEGVGLTIGDWTAGNIKSLAFEDQRNINGRLLQNVSGAHGGFNIGIERTITLDVIVEAAALPAEAPFHAAGGYHPFALMEAGTVHAIGFVIGGVQYNTLEFSAENAQLIEAPEQEEGAASLWALKYELKPSTLVAADECSWIFR